MSNIINIFREGIKTCNQCCLDIKKSDPYSMMFLRGNMTPEIAASYFYNTEFGESFLATLRKYYEIDRNEVVLYSCHSEDEIDETYNNEVEHTHFWETCAYDSKYDKALYVGVVVTDKAIHCLYWDSENKEYCVSHYLWDEIDGVEYQELSIYVKEGDCHEQIHISYFIMGDDDDSMVVIGKKLAEMFDEMAKSVQQNEDPMLKEYCDCLDKAGELYDSGKIEEAISFFKEIMNRKMDGYELDFYSGYARCLCDEEKYNEALKVCNEAFSKLNNDNYYKKDSFVEEYVTERLISTRCLVYKLLSRWKESRIDVSHLLNIDIYEDNRQEYIDEFDEIDNKYCENLLSEPYNDRKIIMPVKEYIGELDQQFVSIVKMKSLPKIEFPLGHPIANELYIGHPYLPHKYLPIDSYELEFVEDRVREFISIMQGIGATEIDVECLNTSSSDRNYSKATSASGSVSFGKAVSVEGGYNTSSGNHLLDQLSKKINLHQRCRPNAICMPHDLVWYQNEPSWQRLVEQRMRGSLLEHEERIETKKTRVVENSEMMNVKAEFSAWIVKGKGNYDVNSDSRFDIQDNAILSIKVKFAPLGSLQQNAPSVNNQTVLSEDEQDYLDMYNEIISEGIMSQKERKLLDKLRVKNGISEERASELEAMATPSLSEDEKEYLDAYKEALAEGDISERDRRSLNRMCKVYGITEERAKEIERMA